MYNYIVNILNKRNITTIFSILIVLLLTPIIFIINNYPQNQPYTTNINSSLIPPPIDHIVIIVDENKSLSSIINNPNAPYINQLTKTGSITSNYHAKNVNPYLAITSGSSLNIPNNCNPQLTRCQANISDITDGIESSGRTWKMYAESMPKSCDFNDTGKYAVRHNPFMYYPSISKDSKQCKNRIVPFSNLIIDIKNSDLPNYIFISPNICNDMHSCSVNTGDRWLSNNIPQILESYAFKTQNSLLIITWDEGSAIDNKVLTIFLGSAAKKRYVSNRLYDHYSILHTIEYLWRLKPLTNNDMNASIMYDMLNYYIIN